MIFFYRYLIAPLAVVALPFAALFNKKISEGLRLRRTLRNYPEFKSKPIWIHAASGEFEYAKSVIRELKARHPEIPIVVTYFSPTYAKNIQNFPGVDFSLPLPLDLPGPVSSFLKRIDPRVLLLARTDFWPELLSQTRAKSIPILVFSYTQKTVKGAIAKRLARWRLEAVDRIYCVSSDDKDGIQRLGVSTPIEVIGDTRYDQVKFRLDHPKALPENLQPDSSSLCLVAGSTWPEDERVLFAAMVDHLKQKKWRLILAPHEPTKAHLESLESQMQKQGLKSQRFSSAQSWGDHDVLLVDQVGWLAELYTWGDVAFVGGSFKRSVHSVMEPLGAGLPVLVGPYHRNNREAVEFQNEFLGQLGAVQSIQDPFAWMARIDQFNSILLRDFKKEFSKRFASRLGATNRLIQSMMSSGLFFR